MKCLISLMVFLFIYVSSQGQITPAINSNEVNFFLDEKGENISRAQFENSLKENPSTFHRWDEVKNDSMRIARLIPGREILDISYPAILKVVKEIIPFTIDGNPLIIIHYNFLNDHCSPASGYNYWDTLRIRRSKRFSDNLERRLEKEFPNLVSLHFFEPGIIIEPSQILKQFFYIDHSRYFRNILFKTPSSCGSIAIIKPGGNTMIFNGESSIPILAGSLPN